MKEKVFWVDDHPRPQGIIGDLPESSDFLIVGSGLTGTSAALRLSEAGRTVVVVEENEIASGASSMNGGMVSPDVKGGIDSVFANYGAEIGREMWDSTVRSIEIVKELTSRHAIDARIADGGMIGLGSSDIHRRAYEREIAWYRKNVGVEWVLIGSDELSDYVGGTDRFNCGMYEPEGFGVHPARLVFGLVEAAERAGTRFVDHCRALSVRRNGGGFAVDTSRGTVDAGEVIIATNGYTTTQPVAALASRVVSVGSYIIVTEPLPDSEAEALFPKNSMSYTRKRLLNYMRRTPDNRILIGGRRNLRPGLDLGASAKDLTRRLTEFWPSLADKQITHVWGGRLAVPFDLYPHIGQVDGVWYAMGYAGHGVGLSTQLGYELAGMLLDEDPPSVYSKIPHHGRWYYRTNPWFLTPASIMYRSLDLIDR